MNAVKQIAISITVIVAATVAIDYVRKTTWYRKHIG